MRAEQTSFLFGANAPFIEELYERYLGDPNAVDPEWRTFFEALGEQKGDVLAEVRGASWAPNGAHVIGAVDPETLPAPANRNVKGNGAAAPAAIAGRTDCARPTAARSASSTCTSPIPTRGRGSRSASSMSKTAPSSPSRVAARSWSGWSRRR